MYEPFIIPILSFVSGVIIALMVQALVNYTSGGVTEKKTKDVAVVQPWFLVVTNSDYRTSLVLAADEVLRINYNYSGEIRISCKNKEQDICLDNQYEFEFLPASRCGDYLVNFEGMYD